MPRFQKVLEQPHGILLVTGPTGSGKTTTLYTALSKLNTPDVKIITVEDPVEYQIEGINQIQAKPQIGLDFANALRSIVRQDPDIIMIGEMRDLETARIAIQSALTGHLVLSTLHTNNAAGGITRLLDMGVEDYLLTSTVNGILAQRLVRRLCLHCRAPEPVTAEALGHLAELYLQSSHGAVDSHSKDARTALISQWLAQLQAHSQGQAPRLWRRVGCAHCEHSGYKGRMGIYELMPSSDAIRAHIRQAVCR